jgi:hypothetical protein
MFFYVYLTFDLNQDGFPIPGADFVLEVSIDPTLPGDLTVYAPNPIRVFVVTATLLEQYSYQLLFTLQVNTSGSASFDIRLNSTATDNIRALNTYVSLGNASP